MVTGAAAVAPHDGAVGTVEEQQAAGVGILLQISMLVLSFVLGHLLRRRKFYYLPEASASLLIGDGLIFKRTSSLLTASNYIPVRIQLSTSTFYRRLNWNNARSPKLIGDSNRYRHLYEENPDGNSIDFMGQNYDEGESTSSKFKLKLREFRRSTSSFALLDKKYLTPIFTSQNGDNTDDDEESNADEALTISTGPRSLEGHD